MKIYLKKLHYKILLGILTVILFLSLFIEFHLIMIPITSIFGTFFIMLFIDVSESSLPFTKAWSGIKEKEKLENLNHILNKYDFKDIEKWVRMKKMKKLDN